MALAQAARRAGGRTLGRPWRRALSDGTARPVASQKKTKPMLFEWTIPSVAQAGHVPRPDSNARRASAEGFAHSTQYLGEAKRAEHVSALNGDSPQVAILGRSNVGKSSLVNALFGKITGAKKKQAAIVSKRPGRTSALQVFGVGRNESWAHRRSLPLFGVVLVDCPGYGFAKASLARRESMSKAIADYLQHRDPSLFARALVLVDASIGITGHDASMIDALEQLKVPYQVILTKCDKVSPLVLQDNAAKVIATLDENADPTLAHGTVLGVSAKDRAMRGPSIARLRSELFMHAGMSSIMRRATLGSQRPY